MGEDNRDQGLRDIERALAGEMPPMCAGTPCRHYARMPNPDMSGGRFCMCCIEESGPKAEGMFDCHGRRVYDHGYGPEFDA